MKLSKNNNYLLLTNNGKKRRISLKKIYRLAYKIEFCHDNIEDLPNEEWKEAVFDKSNVDKGIYFVSNYGRVKSYYFYNANLLVDNTTVKGYHFVRIKDKDYKVHRLVALAFIPNDDITKDTVDHINGDKDLNIVSNLQFLSRSENAKKAAMMRA